mmetsp:Transcript_7174/g.10669  ORF Transcript_7174/g.10669 Transcript_7174/m.10669 type:complete len:435 (-) Transcript_7174:79-1383(-)|eukprot:CAMPEP_0185039492 /NCGR_PEP_ID=MMETSP1103-20130426/36394_1 /TAXON_ID=36769 /ORGANISM="Paraphysomonas bandaiensis, Strain Caron Lab Isolate" /LENGTH=434 /DNA_ID=CAMNT_0027578397 /DNA_START=13 /DNA_END=1317 /DNA_ORIENTATION=-
MTSSNTDIFKYFEQQEKDYVSLKQSSLFNEDSRLIIQRDLPDIDECDKLMSLTGADNDIICQNLFTLMSCCAGDSITYWDSMSVHAQYDLIASNFNHLYESMLIDSYFVHSLFKCPEFGSGPTKKWPDFYEAYVTNKRNVTCTTTFKATNKATKAMTPEYLNHCYFGKQVAARFLEAKRIINNYANPLWIEPCKLKSGETVSGLLDTIRRGLYSVDIFSKCKKLWQSRNNKKKKEEKLSLEELSKAIVETADEELNVMLNQCKKHFPDWWLSFFLLSLPADLRCMKSFNTRTNRIDPQEAPLLDSPMGTGPDRAARRLQQRQSGLERSRPLSALGDEDISQDSSTKKCKRSSNDEPIKIEYVIRLPKDEPDKREILQQQIQLLDVIIRDSSPDEASYYRDIKRKYCLTLFEENKQALIEMSSSDCTTPVLDRSV